MTAFLIGFALFGGAALTWHLHVTAKQINDREDVRP